MSERASPDAYQRRRHAARLAAVQALYQMELSGRGAARVVEEFEHDRIREEDESPEDFDAPHFSALVHTAVDDQDRLDKRLSAVLASGWRLDRLDATVRAILRAGAVELLDMEDVPAAASINAYVDIAHAFFEGPEPGFVNAALDALAKGGGTRAS